MRTYKLVLLIGLLCVPFGHAKEKGASGTNTGGTGPGIDYSVPYCNDVKTQLTAVLGRMVGPRAKADRKTPENILRKGLDAAIAQLKTTEPRLNDKNSLTIRAIKRAIQIMEQVGPIAKDLDRVEGVGSATPMTIHTDWYLNLMVSYVNFIISDVIDNDAAYHIGYSLRYCTDTECRVKREQEMPLYKRYQSQFAEYSTAQMRWFLESFTYAFPAETGGNCRNQETFIGKTSDGGFCLRLAESTSTGALVMLELLSNYLLADIQSPIWKNLLGCLATETELTRDKVAAYNAGDRSLMASDYDALYEVISELNQVIGKIDQEVLCR